MKFLTNLIAYPFLACASIVMTILAIVLSPAIALTVNKEGNLPYFLKWFQTPDAPAWGDESFAAIETPNDSMYVRTVKWLVRNPAQGFDMIIGGTQDSDTEYKVYGRFVDEGSPTKSGVGGGLLITNNKYFHLYIIIPLGNHCIHSEFGWMLRSSVETKDIHPKVSFVFTPIRFYNFYNYGA